MEHMRVKETGELAGDIAVSTVWLWVRTKKFPKPYKLAGRVTVWKRSEVELWLEEQISKSTQDEC